MIETDESNGHTKEQAKNYTILVADDEPALLRLMEFVLQKQGYTMVSATNGEEALEAVRKHNPDLIVLDIMMPKMDGYEVAHQLRADASTRNLPIIMLSAKAQEEDIERGMEIGVNTFITKPFAPDDLRQTVERFLQETNKQARL